MYITPITVLSSQCANVNVAATFSSMLLPIHADFDIFSVFIFYTSPPFQVHIYNEETSETPKPETTVAVEDNDDGEDVEEVGKEDNGVPGLAAAVSACGEDGGDALFSTALANAEQIARRQQAEVLAARAACYRRQSKAALALADADVALELAPALPAALKQQGLALLDSGRPDDAVASFESLLEIDRRYPDIFEWLLHAHARGRHVGCAPANAGYYVGDLVQTVARYPGLWSEGATGKILGLGVVTAPLVILFDRSKETISSQAEHIRLRDRPVDAIEGPKAGSGGASTDGSYASQLASAAAAAASAAFGDGSDEKATAAAEKSEEAEARAQSTFGKDPYYVLSLPADFTPAELRRAYRGQSRKLHPDRGGSTEAFQAVSAAHAILSDSERRRVYDTGSDLRREHYDELPLADQIEAYYFPERQGWRAFGDPHKSKRDVIAAWEREQAAARDEEERRLQDEERARLGALPDESRGSGSDDEGESSADAGHDEL